MIHQGQTCAGCDEVIDPTPGTVLVREELATLMRMDDGTLNLVAPHPVTVFWHQGCWVHEVDRREEYPLL